MNVSYNDPFFERLDYSEKYNFNLKRVDINIKNIKNFDCVILITDHDVYNYDFIKDNSKMIIDTRGKFDNNEKIIRA